MVTEKTIHGVDSVKRRDASVVKRGQGPAVPNERWELNLDLTPEGKNSDCYDAFEPKQGKNRPCMQTKTNECDH